MYDMRKFYYTLECNLCGKLLGDLVPVYSFDDYKQVSNLAALHGWEETSLRDVEYCPECSKKLENSLDIG